MSTASAYHDASLVVDQQNSTSASSSATTNEKEPTSSSFSSSVTAAASRRLSGLIDGDKIAVAAKEMFYIENRITQVTSHFGIVTDCLYNSTRSKRLLVLTYMLVSVLAISFVVALLSVRSPKPTQLEWEIPFPSTFVVGRTITEFSVTLSKGGTSTDPIVGARLQASLIPYRAFPLTVTMKPQNQTHTVRWVDCLSIAAGDLTPLGVQDYTICNIEPHLFNFTATTDSSGVAKFKNMILRSGPATDYLLIVKVVKFGRGDSGQDVFGDNQFEQTNQLQKTVSAIAPTTTLDPVVLHFNNATYVIDVTARISWVTPLSPLQTAVAAASKVGEFANASGFVNLASIGISASSSTFTTNQNVFTMNPMCTFLGTDISHVVDPNIVTFPSTFVFDAQYTNYSFTFLPDQGSNNMKGSATVTLSAHIQSISSGAFLIFSCLGINVPISIFYDPSSIYNSVKNVIVPAVPATTIGTSTRVASIQATITSGLKLTFHGKSRLSNASGMFEFYGFFETDELTANIDLEWTPGMSQVTILPESGQTMRVYCEIYQVAPDNGGFSGVDAAIYAKGGSKMLINGSVDVPLSKNIESGIIHGSATLRARFTSKGIGFGLVHFSCISDGVQSNELLLNVNPATSIESSSVFVAPQPWQTGATNPDQQQQPSSQNQNTSSPSSPSPLTATSTTTTTTTTTATSSQPSSAAAPPSNKNQEIFTEYLGRPWLSSPTLRIISIYGKPLAGKDVSVGVVDGPMSAVVKYSATTSNEHGEISFSFITSTSLGYVPTAITEAQGGVKTVFGFFVDGWLIYNHSVYMRNNPTMQPSSFCNAQMTDFVDTQGFGFGFVGIPLSLKLLVTDGFGQPIKNKQVRVQVNLPVVLLCTAANSSLPFSAAASCPQTSALQFLTSADDGTIDFANLPGNTALAVGGITEQDKIVVFEFECTQPTSPNSQQNNNNNNNNNTNSNANNQLPAPLSSAGGTSTSLNNLVTTPSYLIYRVVSLLSGAMIQRPVIPRPSVLPQAQGFTTTIDMILQLQPSFWYWFDNKTSGADAVTNTSDLLLKNLPLGALHPRIVFYSKPDYALALYDEYDPYFSLVAAPKVITLDNMTNPVNSGATTTTTAAPNSDLPVDPARNRGILLETEFVYLSSVGGLFVGGISFDGSTQVLFSTITTFGSLAVVTSLSIARPLQFIPGKADVAVTGVAAMQQPIITTYAANGTAVYGIPVYAIIRLWDTATNKPIKDVNPFLTPDDLEFGALVDISQPDGRPMSQPSRPGDSSVPPIERYGAVFQALTLAGIQSGATFKIVYKSGGLFQAGDAEATKLFSGCEVEQDTIFAMGTPAPILSAIPSPYAVAGSPVSAVVGQPLAVPMLLIPKSTGALVLNYNQQDSDFIKRSSGGIINDTARTPPWYFSPGTFVTTDFQFQFSQNTPAGSYDFYCLYPGGRTKSFPIVLVKTADAITISAQPPQNVTIGTPFDAKIVATANNIPLAGVAVSIQLVPLYNCDSSTTYFPSSSCGTISGDQIVVTDADGSASVTLTAESGLEGLYYISFGIASRGDGSFEALAKNSLSKLSASTGGLFNTSALPAFGSQVTNLLQNTIRNNFGGGAPGANSIVSNIIGQATGGASSLVNTILAPLISLFSGGGASSLPFKIWNPVSKIQVIGDPISYGAVRPPSRYDTIQSHQFEGRSSRAPPTALVLNRNGLPVKNILVQVVQVPTGMSSASVIFTSGSNQNFTDENGLVSFAALEIRDTSGEGPVQFAYLSLGVSEAIPPAAIAALRNDSSPAAKALLDSVATPGAANATILPPPNSQEEEVSLTERMRNAAFIGIAVLIPLLIANVRRTHIFWVLLGSVFIIVVFVINTLQVTTNNQISKEWTKDTWFRPSYSIFMILLLGLVMLSILWILVRFLWKGRDAFEYQTSNRLRRSYKYTKWIVNVRRPAHETLEGYRNKLNREIRDSIPFKIQSYIEVFLPFRVITMNRVEQITSLPPIPVPDDVEPVQLPLKIWIVLGIVSVITLSLFIVSSWAVAYILDVLTEWNSYIPMGGDQITISTSAATSGELDVSVTLSAQDMQVQMQKAISLLLQLIAQNVPSLTFLNKWARFFGSFDVLGYAYTIAGILGYVLDYLSLAHIVSQVIASISVVITMYVFTESVRSILIDSRRGKYFNLRSQAKFMSADAFIGVQSILFALQHQFVFWTSFIVIIVIVVLIIFKLLMPLIQPLLITALVPLIRTFTIELVAIKFIRSYTNTIKNPFLYSIYSVFSTVMGVFDALLKVLKRVAYGVGYGVLYFARSDMGLFPAQIETMDPAHTAFFAVISLDNRYNHPIFLTAVAVLSVEAKIGALARKEQMLDTDTEIDKKNNNNNITTENNKTKTSKNDKCGEDDDGDTSMKDFSARNGNLNGETSNEDQNIRNNTNSADGVEEEGQGLEDADDQLLSPDHKHYQVDPRILANQCSVPTVASLIQLHAEVLVDRWRQDFARNKYFKEGRSSSSSNTKKFTTTKTTSARSSSTTMIEEQLVSKEEVKSSSTPSNNTKNSDGKVDGGDQTTRESDSYQHLVPQRLPLASELYEEMNKSQRYVKAAKRFRLFVLLHFNPSLRRLRKHTLLKDKQEEEAEQQEEENKRRRIAEEEEAAVSNNGEENGSEVHHQHVDQNADV